MKTTSLSLFATVVLFMAESAAAFPVAPYRLTLPPSAEVKPVLLTKLGFPGSFAWRVEAGHRASANTILEAGEFSPHRLYPNLDSGNIYQAMFEPMRDRTLAFSYSWRALTVEGAAGTPQRQNWRGNGETHADPRAQKLSRIARLSYSPLPGIALRFSRGRWSPVDQIIADADVRRSSLSASYTRNFTGGEWQTTLAWGRNSRRDRESLTGYLAETSIRFAGAHMAFGRFEQVGSDDLPGLSDQKNRWTRLNKLSLGYYQDLHRSRAARVGLGLMASRYIIPPAQALVFHGDPVSYMLFMRLDLQ